MLAGVQGYTHAQQHKQIHPVGLFTILLSRVSMPTFPSYPKKSFHPLLDVLYMYKNRKNLGNYCHFAIIYVGSSHILPHSCGKLAR